MKSRRGFISINIKQQIRNRGGRVSVFICLTVWPHYSIDKINIAW